MFWSTFDRLIKFPLARILHPRIYALGKAEADSAFGMTYGHPYTLKSTAYDLGRAKGGA